MSENTQLSNWRKFLEGDEVAFRNLYENQFDMLLSFGLRYTPNQGLVQDCIHDLFLYVHAKRFTLSQTVKVEAYLLSSLRRRVIKSLDAEKSTDTLKESEYTFQVEWDVEHHLTRSEEDQILYNRLKKALQSLTPRQREAIYLRFSCEHSYEEVSEIMGIPLPTCRTVIYRAIKGLRSELIDVQSPQLLWMLISAKSLK